MRRGGSEVLVNWVTAGVELEVDIFVGEFEAGGLGFWRLGRGDEIGERVVGGGGVDIGEVLLDG